MKPFRRLALERLIASTPVRTHWMRRVRIRKARGEQARILRSRTLKKPAAAGLKAALAKCTDQKPCNEGACPICMQVKQEQVAVAIERMPIPKGYKRYAVTIIPASAITKPGCLNAFNVDHFTRRFKYAFEKADIAWAVFGIDYSFNSSASNEYEPHWAPHIQGLVAAENKRDLIQTLKKAFLKTTGIVRPVRVTPWNENGKWLRYVFKSSFDGREKHCAERFVKETKSYRPCKKTRKVRLCSTEFLELYHHLLHVGLDNRMICLRCQLRRQKDGLVIVPMQQSRRKAE